MTSAMEQVKEMWTDIWTEIWTGILMEAVAWNR